MWILRLVVRILDCNVGNRQGISKVLTTDIWRLLLKTQCQWKSELEVGLHERIDVDGISSKLVFRLIIFE
jgi:hypothetical protein